MKWITITRYSGFYDIPRMFFIEYKGKTLFFECLFDQTTDEYEDSFKVYLMPKLSSEEISAQGSHLASLAEKFISIIPTSLIQFDPSRRKAISEECLKTISLE